MGFESRCCVVKQSRSTGVVVVRHNWQVGGSSFALAVDQDNRLYDGTDDKGRHRRGEFRSVTARR